MAKQKRNKKIRNGIFGNKKILIIFVLLFASVAGTVIFKSFAATGDELQAKDNATWGGAYAKRIILSPDGSYGYTLDAYGALHPFHTYGAQPAIPKGTPYFQGMDIARDVVVSHWDPNNLQGYILDGFGGIHPFGGAAAASGGPYWNGWDIARRIVLVSGGGYILDGYGGLQPFKRGTATKPPAVKQGPYWKADIARDVAIRGDGAVGQVLDCHGGISPVGFGTNSAPGYVNGYPYNGNVCNFQSFTNIEWSKPSGTVIDSKGQFYGFGGASVTKYTDPGIGSIVDGFSRPVNGYRRYWALGSTGKIRAFDSPNVPLFTDAEQKYFEQVQTQENADKWYSAVAQNETTANTTAGGTGGGTGGTNSSSTKLLGNICGYTFQETGNEYTALRAYDATYWGYQKTNPLKPNDWFFTNLYSDINKKRLLAWGAYYMVKNWSDKYCGNPSVAQFSLYLGYVQAAQLKIRDYSSALKNELLI